ncbi:DUF6318 family protein [Cellulosimicrobium sp. 72-3]|uniref:DUF6318 family protein n=1 Tax=Cellulosimicrobium sp. 72-3 TaxID=2731680 RepID=UPI00210F6680|nr:DUF6318 family protein [Cellulosimicrobium sp. 72-3]
MTAGCLVAGCTGGGEPAPSPPVETSAEPSVTEAPEPEPTTTGPPKPERPAAMDRDDAEGAAAAAEYFLELYPYVMSTGDTAEWDAMTWAETCDFCTSVSSEARSIRDKGDAFSGAEITLSNANVGAFDDLIGGYPILFDFDQSPHRRVAPDGNVVSDDDGESGQLQIDMLEKDGNWLVLAVGGSD